MPNNNFMFDTNIFNKLLDENFDLSQLDDQSNFFTTHIQQDEINATPNAERKEKLQEIFAGVSSRNTDPNSHTPKWGEYNFRTNSCVTDISRVNAAKTGDGTRYLQLLSLLNEDKPNRHESNMKDALIGETTLENGFTLVTNDDSLLTGTKELGGNAITFDGFKRGNNRNSSS